MLIKTLQASLVALVVAAIPNHLSAQASTAEEAQAPVPAAESSQIEARIQAVQQQAMQDAEIQAASTELQSLIQTTMLRLAPEFQQYAERAQTLKSDVAAAQAENDNARLHELAAEAQELQQRINDLQARAMEDAAVQQKLEAYRVQLFNRMVEIDPEVRALLQQLQEANA
jgi:chromosome segregation ATPase